MNLKSIFNYFNKSKQIHQIKSKVEENNEFFLEDNFIEAAKTKVKDKHYESALLDFNKVIENDSFNVEAYFERSKLKKILGDEVGSINDLKRAKLILDQNDLGYDALEEAGINYDNGEYLNAVKNYNKAISLIPTLTDIYFNRGIAKEMLKDYVGTVEDFSSAIELKASNITDAYYRRGYIRLYKLSDSVGALEDFNNAIKLNPNEADYYYRRSKVQNTYEALQDLLKAESLGLKDEGLYFDIYFRKLEMDDFRGCINALDKFIALNPVNFKITIAKAYYLRGFLKKILFENESAIIDFDKSIALDNEDAEPYYWRGIIKNNYERNSGDIDIKKAEFLGYKLDENEYDEIESKKIAEKGFQNLVNEVKSEDDLYGKKSKEEIEKVRNEAIAEIKRKFGK